MLFVTVQNKSYNLAHLIYYESLIGQSEVGATATVVVEPEPVFGDFRYVQLVFSTGERVSLDAPQSEAFLAFIGTRSTRLDLDFIEQSTVGTILVHDTEEGGDIFLPARDEDEGTPGEP